MQSLQRAVITCRLYLHEAHEQNGRWHLQQGAVHSGSGIFDMRWQPPLPGHPPVIALGLADGRVQLVRPPPPLSPDDLSAGAADGDLNAGRQAVTSLAAVKPSSAEDTTAGSCCSRDGLAAVDEADDGSNGGWREAAAADVEQEMVLTVDWARHGSYRGRLVASTSSGYLAILQVKSVPFPFPSFRSTQLTAWPCSASKHVRSRHHVRSYSGHPGSRIALGTSYPRHRERRIGTRSCQAFSTQTLEANMVRSSCQSHHMAT